MSTAPSGKSVARARYWLVAVVKAVALAVIVWNAAHLSLAILNQVFNMLLGGSVVGFTAEVGNLWNNCIDRVVWLAVGWFVFATARRAVSMVLPGVGMHCPKCGYSRRGLLSSAPCPECGARLDPAAS